MTGSNYSKGFTLVEMAIVTLVSGFFLVMIVKSYSNEFQRQKHQETREHIEATQGAINEFYFREGRYPCPADPRLPPSDPDYGMEACRPDPTVACVSGAPPPGEPACTSDFARDADGIGGPDRVLIGAVPFITLDLNVVDTPYAVRQGSDGYGRLLSYAVSELMTSAAASYLNPVNPKLGAIDVVDVNNNPVVQPQGSAHYVIFSHGETGVGAYTKRGTLVENCFVSATASPPASGFNPGTAGIQVELENCDNNDAIFVKDLSSYADSDDFNDDVLYFGVNPQTQIWRNSPLAPTGSTYYYNTNAGNVGVGTVSPISKLHVAGDVEAESQAMSTTIEGFCGLSGSDCLDPDFLGGSGFDCPDGEVAVGIEDNQLVCQPLLSGPPTFSTDCASITPGSFMTGFSVDFSGNATPVCVVP